MPLKEISFTILLSSLLTAQSAAGAANVAMPGTADAFALTGGCAAMVLAVYEARQKNRSVWHLFCVVVATLLAATTVPALAVLHAAPEKYSVLTWHYWAAAGFACGVMGWPVGHAIQKLGPWLARWITGEAKRRIGGDNESDGDG